MEKRSHKYYDFGNFRLDTGERVLLRDNEPVLITQKAFETLHVLVQNCGHVLEKNELMSRIWPDSFVEESTLAQNISTLRKILGEPPDRDRYIETVPKRGYRFVAKVKEYTVEDPIQATGSQTEAARDLNTIAVLPFKSLTPNGDDRYLGLGMTDILITKLSNVRKIRVRPTSTILRYDNLDQGPAIVGKELKVKYVLDGKIQRAGDWIRVTVQLINVDDGTPLWADKFDERFIDTFSVQDKIADRLIEALTVQLANDERRLLAKHHTMNSEDYH